MEASISNRKQTVAASATDIDLPVVEWQSHGDAVQLVRAGACVGGLTANELFGPDRSLAAFLERVHPDDRSSVVEPPASEYSIAYRVRSSDGLYVPVVEHGRYDFSPEGVPQRHAMLADAPVLSMPEDVDRQRALVRLATHPAFVRGDLEEAGPIVVRTVAEVLDVQRVTLWLFEDNPRRLRCEWSHDRDAGTTERGSAELLAADYPVYMNSLGEGRALAANDAQVDRRTREFRESYLVSRGISSLLDAPIRVGGEVVGILCLEHVGPVRKWRTEESVFAADAADQVAQLLLNAQSAEANERNALLEKQLQRAERLKAVGRLASGVAHDFNNVLFCMLTNIEFARNEVGNEHAARTYLAEAEAAGWRAAELVRQLLAFSRRQVLQPTLIDLHLLVEDMGRMLRRLLPESIELDFRREEGVGLVRGDRAQLEQVVVNLVVNARQAMGDRGRIEIATYASTGSKNTAGLVVEVSDSGPGVPESEYEHIFDPFYTTRTNEGGTGLGLSTVFGVARQHHGDIEVGRSRLGGALFRVWLPSVDVSQPPPTLSRPLREAGLPASAETVLLAEDEELVRTAARRLLEREGYRVIEASDGAEAVEVFSRAEPKPAVVVLDAVMPRMSGRETYDAIRATGARPSFLLVTGLGQDESLVEAEDVVVMTKPYGTNDLLRAVRRLAAN